MKQLKVIELFSGIGSQAKTLKNINIVNKIVEISDWDICTYWLCFDTSII